MLGFFAWRALSLHACVTYNLLTIARCAAYIWFGAHIGVSNLCAARDDSYLPEQDRICCTDCTCVRRLWRCVNLLSRDSSWACALILQHWKYLCCSKPSVCTGCGLNMSQGNICYWRKKKTILFLIVLEFKKKSNVNYCWCFLDQWICPYGVLSQFMAGYIQWPTFPVIFLVPDVAYSHKAVKYLSMLFYLKYVFSCSFLPWNSRTAPCMTMRKQACVCVCSWGNGAVIIKSWLWKKNVILQAW